MVVAARVAGLSHGFLVFDDTGSEWTYDGTQYQHRLFPNRFLYSREAGKDKAPYFTIELGPEDRDPPHSIKLGNTETGGYNFWAPSDTGPGQAQVLGFRVKANGQELPTWNTPKSARPGDVVEGSLAEAGFEPGTQVQVEVAGVDGAANTGPWTKIDVKIPREREIEQAQLPSSPVEPFQETAAPRPVKLGDSGQVFVVDELDTFTALGQAGTGPRPKFYNQANHLWQARNRRVQIQAARNEFVALQAVISGSDPALNHTRASLTFADKRSVGIQVEIGKYLEVPTANGAWVGDPIVPQGHTRSWPDVPGRTQRSLHVELYVPHNTPPGKHEGTLKLEANGASTELIVTLTVWDFALGDRLTFLPEMNCYDLPANERDYYRLAHKHRTFINRVPYHQNGVVSEGAAPRWDGKMLDWTAWDRRFGPLFDGSAFADLPRKGIPIDGFYLPMHENWPTPIEGNYNGNYWADLAFTSEYRAALVEVSRQFAQHLKEKKWQSTIFQGFLNGKNDFKKNGWSRGSSPWLLDEPANFQDFWALRWFGLAMHEGWNSLAFDSSGPKLSYRVDLSRPQWQRDTLADLSDYLVISGEAFRQYGKLQQQQSTRDQVLIEYGAANPIGSSNLQAVAWCLDAWSRGLNGVLPWQTIGTIDSWTKADELALFYPGQNETEPPVPSVRLKAFRRGQQDVEYLNRLSPIRNPATHHPFAAQVRQSLALDARHEKSGPDTDAAVRLLYDQIDPLKLWKLRAQLAATAPVKRAPDLQPVSQNGRGRSTDRPNDNSRPFAAYVPGSTIVGQSGFTGTLERPLNPVTVPAMP